MTNEIAKKVEQIKNSFSVEGTPLIMSDRFSTKDINEMKKDSTAHSSHWYYPPKVYTDEEIAIQIQAFLDVTPFTENQLREFYEYVKKSLKYEDMAKDRALAEQVICLGLGWKEKVPFDPNFWRKFGSAPLLISKSNTKLVKYAKLYGAVSMKEIFGEKFTECYHLVYAVPNLFREFEDMWKEEKRKKDLKKQVFISEFNSLEDIEENVVVKKVTEAARNFYMDKTKDFEERVKVFTKHGNREGSIFHPSDTDLKRIFEMYTENDLERYSFYDCADIVWEWVCNGKTHRQKLDWNNPYHPVTKKKPRKRPISEEAIQRLYQYYMEKLFLEGVGSFEFDW